MTIQAPESSILAAQRRGARQSDRRRRSGRSLNHRPLPQDRRTDRFWPGQPAWNDTAARLLPVRRLCRSMATASTCFEEPGRENRHGRRLHQRPPHQGHLGDGRLLRHPGRRCFRCTEGREECCHDGGGSHRQCRVRIQKGPRPVRTDVPTDKPTPATHRCSTAARSQTLASKTIRHCEFRLDQLGLERQARLLG